MLVTTVGAYLSDARLVPIKTKRFLEIHTRHILSILVCDHRANPLCVPTVAQPVKEVLERSRDLDSEVRCMQCARCQHGARSYHWVATHNN